MFAPVYLDHNATTPLRPQARDAMLAALGAVGHASSVHAEGRRARGLVDEARGDALHAARSQAQRAITLVGLGRLGFGVAGGVAAVSGLRRLCHPVSAAARGPPGGARPAAQGLGPRRLGTLRLGRQAGEGRRRSQQVARFEAMLAQVPPSRMSPRSSRDLE